LSHGCAILRNQTKFNTSLMFLLPPLKDVEGPKAALHAASGRGPWRLQGRAFRLHAHADVRPAPGLNDAWHLPGTARRHTQGPDERERRQGTDSGTGAPAIPGDRRSLRRAARVLLSPPAEDISRQIANSSPNRPEREWTFVQSSVQQRFPDTWRPK
jgi:hypothetical protein